MENRENNELPESLREKSVAVTRDFLTRICVGGECCGRYRLYDRFGTPLSFVSVKDGVWYFTAVYNINDTSERVYDHPERHVVVVDTMPDLTPWEARVKGIVDAKCSEETLASSAGAISVRISNWTAKGIAAELVSGVAPKEDVVGRAIEDVTGTSAANFALHNSTAAAIAGRVYDIVMESIGLDIGDRK